MNESDSRLNSTGKDERVVAREGADYFYHGHPLTWPQVWLSLKKRAELYEIWRGKAGSFRGLRILDFGTTPDLSRKDSNCIVRWLIRDGAQVSLISVEEIAHLGQAFPGVTILPTLQRRADGTSFMPDSVLAEHQFDWVCSSAVLEHVGSRENQIAHLRECSRVARGIFLTTPAREHWLEFHTKLPFIHWLPRARHRQILRKLGHEDWSREEWLRLLSEPELSELAQQAFGPNREFSMHHVRALGAVSNLLLLARPV